MVANPFRLRASEQATRDEQFLSLVGPVVLDMLPTDQLWDRLLIIESAPGADKTTLLRLFTPSSLRFLERMGNQDAYKALSDRLKKLDVISDHGSHVAGVLVNCREQYATIQDLPIDDATQLRWFFALLDARATLLAIRSILNLHDLSFPSDSKRLLLVPNGSSTVASVPLNGTELYEKASEAERALTDSLNSLVGVTDVTSYLRSSLQTIRYISECDLYLDQTQMTERMLFMFDDVHELSPLQRNALRRELEHRNLAFGRWIAQRWQPLEPSEVLNNARTKGRDFEQIWIEEWAKEKKGSRFFSLLDEVGNRRTQKANVGMELFESVLMSGFTPIEMVKAEDAQAKARIQVMELARGQHKFDDWINREMDEAGEVADPFEGAIRWRKLAIMMERQLSKRQGMLDLPLPAAQLDTSESAGFRTAAELFLAKEHGLPYYYGIRRARQLAFWNIEQFLKIAGDLFDQVLTSITLTRDGMAPLTATQQDAMVRRVSQTQLSLIPTEVPLGADVQRLVIAIGEFCEEITHRGSASYLPGVTGVGISAADLDRLKGIASTPNESALYKLGLVLASAVANNIMQVNFDVRVKDGTWTIFYLNRLYCPAFDLPLEYGGFRERVGIDNLASWMEHGYTGRQSARLSL